MALLLLAHLTLIDAGPLEPTINKRVRIFGAATRAL
jgi:hypothetical protein